MSDLTEFDFGDREALFLGLANALQDQLQAAIERRGVALLAVSGGSTPKHLFPILATRDVDWARVQVCLVDERWVDADSTDSNERLVRDLLLQGDAAKASFVPMKTADASPEQGLQNRLPDYNALAWPADVTILGMGEDGHTASLFPSAPELEFGLTTSQRLIAANPKAAPYARMSLSLAGVLDTRKVVLVITGETKKAVFDAAVEVNDPRQHPIIAAVGASPPVDFYYAP